MGDDLVNRKYQPHQDTYNDHYEDEFPLDVDDYEGDEDEDWNVTDSENISKPHIKE